MNAISIAFLLLFFTLSGYAQQSGSRLSALGIGGVALQDPWCTGFGGAGTAAQPGVVAGTSCSFLDGEPKVITTTLIALVPRGRFVTGADLFTRRLGEVYREDRFGLLCSGKIGRELFLGMKLNYYGIRISNYGHAAAWSAETGIQYQPVSKLLIGASVSNPSANTYSRMVRAEIPVQVAFGASLTLNEEVLLVTELEKIPGVSMNCAAGVEYRIGQRLFFRGGIEGMPLAHHAGLGMKAGNFDIGCAYGTVQSTGNGSQFSIHYEF
jgi:hypothetical protein